MNPRATIQLLAGSMLAIAFTSVSGNDATDGDFRRAVIDAKDCFRAVVAYDDLFRHYGPERLLELRADTDANISIQASYSLIRQGSYPGYLRNPNRFVGFLEGQTGLQVPAWWHSALVEKTIRDYPELATFRDIGLLKDSTPPRLEKSGFEDYLVMSGSSIGRDKGSILLKHGKDEAAFAEAAFLPIMNSLSSRKYPQLHFAILPDAAVLIGTHGMGPGPFPIWCLNRKTGELTWSESLWITGVTGVSGPPSQYVFEFVVNRQSQLLAVFGTGTTGRNLIVESFDLRTGKPGVRFSTETWNLGPGPRALDSPSKM